MLFLSFSYIHMKGRISMTRRDIAFLQFQQEYPSVSVIVNLAQNMPDRQGNATKLKDALKTVKERLLQELSEFEADSIINNARDAVEAFDYATTKAKSVAIFVNKNVARVFLLPVALPERIEVGPVFEIRDIVGALQRMPRYWVLLLSEKPTRLFQGFGQELVEIIEPVQDALGNDQDGFPYNFLAPNEEHVNDKVGEDLHRGAKYFDDCKEKFFERVFKLFERFLKVDPLPLIVISDEKNHHLFERASHEHPLAGWVHGDYCKRSVHDIAPLVWPVVSKYLDTECAKKLSFFKEQAMGNNKHACGIKAVWAAAQEGRIHELLLEEDFKAFGRVDGDNPLSIDLTDNTSPERHDLVNELIEIVLSKGDAIVTFCPKDVLKEYGHVVAVLRY